MKSSQKERRLLVTSILFTLYWRGINTDDKSSSDISANIIGIPEIKHLEQQSKLSKANNRDVENNVNDKEDRKKRQTHPQKKSRDEIEPRKSRQNINETTRSSNRTVQANNYAFIQTHRPDPTDNINSENWNTTSSQPKFVIPVQYYNQIPNRRHKDDDNDIVRPRKSFSKNENSRKINSEEKKTARHKKITSSYPELSKREFKSKKTTKKPKKASHSKSIQPHFDQESDSEKFQSTKESTTASVFKESMSFEELQQFYRTVLQTDNFITTENQNILSTKTNKKHTREYQKRYSKIVRQGQHSKNGTDIKTDKGKAQNSMKTVKSAEVTEFTHRSTNSLKKSNKMSSTTTLKTKNNNEGFIKREGSTIQENAFNVFNASPPNNADRVETTIDVVPKKTTIPSTFTTNKNIFYRDSDDFKRVPPELQSVKNIRSYIKHEHKSNETSQKKKKKKTSKGKKVFRQKGGINYPNKSPLRSTRLFVDDEDPPEQPYEEKTTPRAEMLSPYSIEIQMKRFADYYNNNNIANVTVEVIGRTVEYNNIVLLKITEAAKDVGFRAQDSKFVDEKPEKKIIFIVHGLSVAGMRHLIKNEDDLNMIMQYYLEHLDKFDFFVIPIANPDGLAANSNSQAEGYWNKNMSPQGSCAGVVLDRNFDIAWNMTHNISPCSHLYPGRAAFSEAETSAIREVMHLNSHRIEAFIHVHASSYKSTIFKGDAVLYPQGYTDFPVDDDKYIDLKGEVEEVMKNASFKIISVTVDSLYNWYGKVSGTSVDYASTVYGIPFAMEFVMQLYENHQKDAFEKIWKQIINTAIMNIWKCQQSQGENNYN